jgi:type IV pilus assembly protein PilO
MIYRPKSVEIAQFQNELNEIQREKAEKEKIVADLDQFNREVAELEQRLQEALSQLPNEKEIDKILAQLSRLIEDSGLSLNKFQVMPEVSKSLYNEVPINLELTGNYHNIALFFDKASKLKRIINFSNLKLGDAQKISGETTIGVSCTATTFRFIKGAVSAKTKKGGKGPKGGKKKK